MLPSVMDDPSNRRQPNKVQLVPKLSPAYTVQLPFIADWPNNPPRKQTVFMRKSPHDGKLYDVVIDMPYKAFFKAYVSWCNGTHIQTAFKNLDSGIREFIVSGITPDQWDVLFPPDKNEE